jgi:ABC-type sugar transport system ATPase subunit
MMDEPNSSLTDVESERLFAVIENLKRKGISIIYVSHKIPEVLRISDRISVLRDGKYIGTIERKDASVDHIIQMMVGRNLEFGTLKQSRPQGSPVLRVDRLTGPGFKDVTFELRKGEILGFAGLVGAGRSEVARAIFGAAQHVSGSVVLEDTPVKFRSPREAIEHGLAMVQEDYSGPGCQDTPS